MKDGVDLVDVPAELAAALAAEIRELDGHEFAFVIEVSFKGGGLAVHMEAIGSAPRPLSKELAARVMLSAASRFLPKAELDKINVTEAGPLSS